MRRATILFFIVLALAHLGATDVSGNQSGTWAQAGNPYNIIGDITVPAELSLTIEPGVEVYVMGNFRLAAAGPLFAVGTESDTIRFMSGQADPERTLEGHQTGKHQPREPHRSLLHRKGRLRDKFARFARGYPSQQI